MIFYFANRTLKIRLMLVFRMLFSSPSREYVASHKSALDGIELWMHENLCFLLCS